MKRPTVRIILLLLVASCGAIGCAASGATDQPGGPSTSTGGAPGTGGSTGSAGSSGTGGVGVGGASASGGLAGGGSVGTGGAATITATGGAGAVAGSPGSAGSAGTAGRAGAPGTGGGLGAAGSTGVGGGGNPVTIWLAGDSTVQTYAPGNTEGFNMTSIEGWGQELAPFFNDRVVINNQAIGGRSVAFFMWTVVRDAAGVYQCVDDQGNPQYQLDAGGNRVDTSQWARIKSGIKAGDFLLIQFGTNDETHTCPRYVTLPDFETDFGIMADAVRAKGATPIFVTPMGHRSFSGTTVVNTLLPYASAMKDEAAMKAVEVEDLNLRSMEYYMMVGNTFLASSIFDGGTTHFLAAGAVKMAELIAGEVRRNNGPLAAYLK
jgi:lysophospholipase L1-like esterase